jgi:hypothetical protein
LCYPLCYPFIEARTKPTFVHRTPAKSKAGASPNKRKTPVKAAAPKSDSAKKSTAKKGKRKAESDSDEDYAVEIVRACVCV